MKRPNSLSAIYENGHNGSILCLDKNPYDKRFLLTLGRDNLIICWPLKTKKILNKIKLNRPCTQVIWSRKNKDCFICAGIDGTILYGRINLLKI